MRAQPDLGWLGLAVCAVRIVCPQARAHVTDDQRVRWVVTQDALPCYCPMRRHVAALLSPRCISNVEMVVRGDVRWL